VRQLPGQGVHQCPVLRLGHWPRRIARARESHGHPPRGPGTSQRQPAACPQPPGRCWRASSWLPPWPGPGAPRRQGRFLGGMTWVLGCGGLLQAGVGVLLAPLGVLGLAPVRVGVLTPWRRVASGPYV